MTFTIPFDTYAVMTRLTEAGVVEKQAKVFVDVIAEGLQHVEQSYARQETVEREVENIERELEGVATKEDIVRLEARMDRLEDSIRLVEMRLTLKITAIIVGALAFFEALQRFTL